MNSTTVLLLFLIFICSESCIPDGVQIDSANCRLGGFSCGHNTFGDNAYGVCDDSDKYMTICGSRANCETSGITDITSCSKKVEELGSDSIRVKQCHTDGIFFYEKCDITPTENPWCGCLRANQNSTNYEVLCSQSNHNVYKITPDQPEQTDAPKSSTQAPISSTQTTDGNPDNAAFRHSLSILMGLCFLLFS